MTDSDRVREYAFRTYIQPARRQGKKTATIVAGDIAKALKLMNRLPLVCAALGTLKLQRTYGVTLDTREGPGQSTTSEFTFKV